tara:strand:- start:1184 stop:1354 length:171 start_codon:yes stop_codon:yes gene_type:complete
MKRNEFFIEFFPATSLFGFSVSQYESKIEEEGDWCPTFRIAFGLIFFTLSYTRISV